MAALKGADILLPNFNLHGGFWTLVGFTIVLGLLNWIVKPILIFFSIPLIVLTIGFFYLVINALILYFASVVFPGVLSATTFGVFWGSVIVSVLHWLLTAIFRGKRD
jgi:Predicted membrane protein